MKRRYIDPYATPWVRPPIKYKSGLPAHQIFLGNWVVHMRSGRIGKIVEITKAKKKNLLLSFDIAGNPTRNGQQDFFSPYSLRPATEEETIYAKGLENGQHPTSGN